MTVPNPIYEIVFKYSTNLIILFVMLLTSSCGKDGNEEETRVDRPVATMHEGYYTIPASAEGIDQTFVKMGIKDTTLFQNRWCAFVGDSITILTGTKYPEEDQWRFVQVFVYVRGEQRLNETFMKPSGTTAKLVKEKALFAYKGTIFVPLQMGDSEMLMGLGGNGVNSFKDATFFDYIWDEGLDLMVYHDNTGQYYVENIFGGNPVKFLPAYKENVPIGWEYGSWNSLGGETDFEQDGKVVFRADRVSDSEPSASYVIHLTHEAMKELELNGGKTKRKYWHVANRGTEQASYEFVVEYPNGHEYRMALRTNTFGALRLDGDVIVSYQGNTYSTTPEYSTLPCRFLTTYFQLWAESNPFGKFSLVTLQEGTDGKELRFTSSYLPRESYPAASGYDYLLGQNNSLIFGFSNLFSNVNRKPELNDFLPFYYLLIYDGSCPNCSTTLLDIDYDESVARCSRCQRWYDLNNYGAIIRGDDGKALIRYPATYDEYLHHLAIEN